METGLIAVDEGVSVEDFLASEALEQGRREYLGGYVYPVIRDGSLNHNLIAGNCFAYLKTKLQDSGCRAFVSDVMVRLVVEEDTYFYYPDIVVTCDPDDRNPQFLMAPKVLIEVISPSTVRVDTREKWYLYRNSPAIEEIVLLEQNSRGGKIARRNEGWKTEALNAGVVELKSLGVTISFDVVYEGVTPTT